MIFRIITILIFVLIFLTNSALVFAARPDNPSGLKADSVSTDSFHVSWSTISGDSIFYEVWIDRNDKQKAETTEANFTGLTAGKDYVVVVRACNSADTSLESCSFTTSIVVKTNPGAVQQPQDGEAGGVNQNPGKGGTGGDVTGAPVQGGFSLTGGIDLKDEYGFGNIPTLGAALGLLVPTLFAVATVAVLFYIIFAGFKFLTSGGNKDSIAGARAMITHSIIAFVMLIMLFILLRFIPEIFGLELDIITPFAPALPAVPAPGGASGI